MPAAPSRVPLMPYHAMPCLPVARGRRCVYQYISIFNPPAARQDACFLIAQQQPASSWLTNYPPALARLAPSNELLP